MVPVEKQYVGGSDCGSFANATAIVFGRDPSKEVYHQSLMQSHIITCFEQKIELFYSNDIHKQCAVNIVT